MARIVDKIVILRSFQQSAEEIYDSSHFRQEHIPFFDKVTFHQLKDAATGVLAREKFTSLSELFSVELKFTIDTLTNWFKQLIISKFLELDNIKKEIFVKENPISPSKTNCFVCGFLLDIEGSCSNEDDKKTWYDFVGEKEHLFIRNVYSKQELADMENISNIEDFHKVFGRFVKIVMLLEKYLYKPRVGKDSLLEEFFRYDLTDEFCHLGEIRNTIDEFKAMRKFGKCDYIDKTIGFVYANIMKLKETEKVKF